MNENMIQIRAVEGRSLPLESHPLRRVMGTMYVVESSYYRRALENGDVELVHQPLAEIPPIVPTPEPFVDSVSEENEEVA